MNKTKSVYYLLPAFFLASVYCDGFLLYGGSFKLLLLPVIVDVLSGFGNMILAFRCCRRRQKDFL